MPFELLQPRGLWAALAAVPIVLLYVLRIRRPRRIVGSVWLWQLAERDLLAKHPFRRLTPETSLLLQLLAALALALALSQPTTRGTRIAGTHVALVIDTSASMAATDDAGRRRLDLAKARAANVIDGLAPGADVLVVDAANDARVVLPPERDRLRIKKAIETLAVRQVAGSLEGAVALAVDRLRGMGGSARIVVLTDGALGTRDEVVIESSDLPLDVMTVGESAENVAIVRSEVRRERNPATGRDEARIFASIRNFGTQPRDVFVTASTSTKAGAEQVRASRRILVPPEGTEPVLLTFAPRADEEERVRIALAPGNGAVAVDALPLDDVAYGVLPPTSDLTVVLASDRNPSWLDRVIESASGIDLRRLSYKQLGEVPVAPDAFVMVEGRCPEALPGKDAFVVDPAEGVCGSVRIGAERPLGDEAVRWNTSDPRLRYLSFDGVTFSRTRTIEATVQSGLVWGRHGMLLADGSTPGRSITVAGFSLEATNLTTKAAFVVLVRNLLESAKSKRAGLSAAGRATDEPIRLAVPRDTAEVTVVGPTGAHTKIVARDGSVVGAPPSEAGVYTAIWEEPRPGSLLFAVNLASERESELRATKLTVRSGGTSRPASASSTSLGHRDLTWLFALTALIAVAVDAILLALQGLRERSRSGLPPESSRTEDGRQRSMLWKLLRWTVAAIGAMPLAAFLLTERGVIAEPAIRFVWWPPLVALAIVFPVAVGAGSWLPTRLAPRRRHAVTVALAGVTAALLLAMAEPEWGRAMTRKAVALLVDRSRSMDLAPNADARLNAERVLAEAGMQPDDRIATIVFGAEAAVEDPLRPRSDAPPPQTVPVARDGTHIEAAIRRGLAELPADAVGVVALLSDGVETRGDGAHAATLARAAGVPIDAVLIEQRGMRNVAISSVQAPSRVSEGAPFELRVTTESAVDAEVEVRLRRGGEVVRRWKSTLRAGTDLLRLREVADAPGLQRYDVELTATDGSADGLPEDNRRSAFVHVRGQALALVLEGDPGRAAPMERALAGAGFLVDVRGPSAVPATAAEFAAFDVVVWSDVAAREVTREQLAALASYAHDTGGGVLLMGGDRSYGPGGFARTPVEAMAPVSFDLKQDSRRTSLAQVIVIDYSGSMAARVGNESKLSLANEAAARSASLLGPGDRLGVAHVDDRVAWTIPLAPMTDERATQERIRAVTVGGGGIYTDLALDTAYAALDAEKTQLKHVLLFADGDDAEQLRGCRGRAARAFARGITTSVISLGRGHDTAELEAVSRSGHGRFYLIDDATRLPAVFTQETILAARASLREEPFRATLTAETAATRQVPFALAPALRGYAVTAPKPGATVGLTALDGEPLLAEWAYGLGHVAAFTSDYKDRWGKDWLGWPDGARFFGQLAQSIARRSGDAHARIAADVVSGELHARVDLQDREGRAQSFRRLRAHITGPDGRVRVVPAEVAGAGSYAARIPLDVPGPYVVAVVDEASGEPVIVTGVAHDGSDELRSTGSDRAALERIASLSGGRLRESLAGIFRERRGRRFAYEGLSRALYTISVVLLVALVSARRLAVPDVVARAAERWRIRMGARRASREARRHEIRQRAATGQAHVAALGSRVARRRKTHEPPDTAALSLGTSPPPQDPAPPKVEAPPQAPAAGPTRTAAEILAERRRKKER